jgi:hypothetical protein
MWWWTFLDLVKNVIITLTNRVRWPGAEGDNASVSRNELKSTVIGWCKTIWVDRRLSSLIKEFPQMTFLQSIVWQWTAVFSFVQNLRPSATTKQSPDSEERGMIWLRKSEGIQSTIKYRFKPSHRRVFHFKANSWRWWCNQPSRSLYVPSELKEDNWNIRLVGEKSDSVSFGHRKIRVLSSGGRIEESLSGSLVNSRDMAFPASLRYLDSVIQPPLFTLLSKSTVRVNEKVPADRFSFVGIKFRKVVWQTFWRAKLPRFSLAVHFIPESRTSTFSPITNSLFLSLQKPTTVRPISFSFPSSELRETPQALHSRIKWKARENRGSIALQNVCEPTFVNFMSTKEDRSAGTFSLTANRRFWERCKRWRLNNRAEISRWGWKRYISWVHRRSTERFLYPTSRRKAENCSATERNGIGFLANQPDISVIFFWFRRNI